MNIRGIKIFFFNFFLFFKIQKTYNSLFFFFEPLNSPECILDARR